MVRVYSKNAKKFTECIIVPKTGDFFHQLFSARALFAILLFGKALVKFKMNELRS